MKNMCIAVIVMAILYGIIFVGAWKSELKVRLKSTTKFEKIGLMMIAMLLFVIDIIAIAHDNSLPSAPTGYVLNGFSDILNTVLAADASLILLVYFVFMAVPAVFLLTFSLRSLVEKYIKSAVPMYLLGMIGVASASVYRLGNWNIADLFVLLLISTVFFIYSSGNIARLSKKCRLLMLIIIVIAILVAACNMVVPIRALLFAAEYTVIAMLMGWLWKKLRYFRKIWKAIVIITILAIVIWSHCMWLM